MNDSPPSIRLVRSVRALGDALITSAQQRATLLSIELHEEKFRLIQAFIWINAAIVAVTMALTFASLLLVCLFWDSARLAIFGGLAVLYTGAAVAVALALRRALHRHPRPLAGTIEELEKDRACFLKHS